MRPVKAITILLFLFMQMALLYAILSENTGSWLLLLIISTVAILVLVGNAMLTLHHPEHLFEDILVAVWVPVGAIITFSLNVYANLGAVIAASGFGLAASFIPLLNKNSDYLKQLPPALYCGAFVGMCADKVATSLGFIITASIVTAIFLTLSKSLFTGVGGKLGTLAFGGVVITSFIFFLFFK